MKKNIIILALAGYFLFIFSDYIVFIGMVIAYCFVMLLASALI